MNNHDKLIQELNQIPDHLAATLLDIVYQLKKCDHYTPNTPKPIQSPTLHSFLGALKTSPSFLGDPVAIQHQMRNDWD